MTDVNQTLAGVETKSETASNANEQSLVRVHLTRHSRFAEQQLREAYERVLREQQQLHSDFELTLGDGI